MEKIKEFRMRARLKGKNRIRLFRQAAKRLTSHITSYEHVTGIVFLGGLTRGFTDKSSDLDGMVFLERKNQVQETQIRDMVTEEAKRSGIDIDMEIHLLRDFAKWRWTEINRWDFSHAQIAFDKKEHVRKIIEARLKVPDEFWTRRIVVCAEYMKWYCYSPKKSIGTIAEAWIDRGDLISAHYCVNYGVELILRAVFALNREFIPPPKWRVYYFRDLKWLPKNHNLLDQAMRVTDLSVDDLRRRLEAVRQIWTEVFSKIKHDMGLGPEETSRYYVQRILKQRTLD
jgi:predicted nucleotidyltransferase